VFATAAALIALAAPRAGAAITPEARAVVERHIEAAGGRALLEGARSSHVRATLRAFGLTGSTETWAQWPDRRASATMLGPFSLKDGFDGEVAWRIDPSGKLVLLDGRNRDDALASAWFENERWLDPDQGGGTVSIAGVETDSLGTFDVLELTPPRGRSRRLYVDRATGYVVRATTKQDAQGIVSTFSDFRRTAGRMLAHTTRTSVVGMPANDLVVTVDSVAFGVPLDPVVFATPEPPATPITWLKTPGRAALPIRYTAKHVWLRASINGHPPADFLFDTGASITVLDSAYAHSIGVESVGRLQGQGAGSTGSGAFGLVQSIRAAGEDGDGVELTDQRVALLALNRDLAPFFWRDIAGVIGYTFISRFVNEIDYDGERLVLHDPSTYAYTGKGATLPLTLAGTMPVTHATLDGRYAGDFRIDVGSSSTVDLHGPFVKRHGLEGKAKKRIEVTGGGFGGTFTSVLTRMKGFALGPYAWKDPLVVLSRADRGAFASTDYAGNIGNGILERFRCVFDYERRQLHLEPGTRFGKRDGFSRSGVQLALMDGVVKAMQVLPGSPAETAGLRVGDEVASIDGRPARDWGPDGVRDLFETGAVGTEHVLIARRDGNELRLTMKLRELI
jgi:hypothetical protein